MIGVDENDTDFNTVEKSGGSKAKTLAVENIPSHNHTASSTSTSSSSFKGTKITGAFGGAGNRTAFEYASGPFSVYTGNKTTPGAAASDFNNAYYSINFSYTPTGTVSTQATTTTTISNTGSGTEFDVKNPYITVYMFRRIS